MGYGGYGDLCGSKTGGAAADDGDMLISIQFEVFSLKFEKIPYFSFIK
jgi:hypothetical protein